MIIIILQEERELIIEYGKKLVASGLTTGTGGNISIYRPEEQLMAISPSGIDYDRIKPADVVVLDLDYNIIDSDKLPSSEYSMHRIFYARREQVRAIVHTHSIYATTIAALNWELPAVHYLIGFSGNEVPLARYATFGTEELANNAFEGMGNYNAVLLANHGLLAVGSDLHLAFNTAEEIEFTCQVYYRAKSIGDPVILPEQEMEIIIEKFKNYGQKK